MTARPSGSSDGAPTDRAPATGRRSDLITAGIVAAVVVVDQLTKNWALQTFEWAPRHVIWTLQFVVTHNTGAAFSLFSGRGVGPVIAMLAVVVVVIVVRTLRFVEGWPAVIGSGLVIGGAIGNLADRLFRARGEGFLQGAVVDWIDFGWWPVFNVADMAITVGAVTLGFAAFFAPVDEDADDEPEADKSTSAQSDADDTPS